MSLRKILFVMAALAVGAGSERTASANTEISVTGIHDGNSPYLVVLEDDAGSSRREPGIYTPDAKGRFQPIIKGNVLVGGPMQGVLHQFAMTKFNRAYPCISVVDGKLHLYQLNIEPVPSGALAEVVEIGGENMPLFDVNGAPVNLPPITSVEDVTVYPLAASNQHQIFAVSVKTAASVMGDGVTFVGVLSNLIDEDPGSPLLKHPPVVIDYKFQDYARLQSLFVANHADPTRANIFSRIALRRVLPRNGRTEEAPALQLWKQRVQALLQKLDKGEKPQAATDIPVYDILLGAIQVGHYPYLQVSQDGRNIYQIYDPITAQDGIVLDASPSQIKGSKEFSMFGRVNLKPDGKPYYYSAPGREQTSLVYIGNELYLTLGPNYGGNGKGSLLRLQTGTSLPDALSYTVQEIGFTSDADPSQPPAPATKRMFNVFVSTKIGGTSQTAVYVVSQHGANVALDRAHTLNDKFYEQGDIIERVQMVTDSETNQKTVLFDEITPPQENSGAYRQAHRQTIPYTDITNTLGANGGYSKAQKYLQALDSKQINARLTYELYDSEGALTNQSGISIQGPSGKLSQKLMGELLTAEDITSENGSLASQTIELKHNGSNLKMKLGVVALDGGFRHGKSNFTLAGVLTSESSHADDHFNPAVFQQPFNFPFERLRGVMVIPGTKKWKDLVTLLVFVEGDPAPNSGDNTRAGIYALTLPIKTETVDGKIKVSYNEMNYRQFEVGTVPPSEILSRLRYDAEGQPHWVKDPTLIESHDNYTVIPFSSGIVVTPNRSSKNRVKWADDKENRRNLGIDSSYDDEYSHSYFSLSTKWDIWSNVSVSRRLGDLGEIKQKEVDTLNATYADLDVKLDAIASSQDSKVIFVVPSRLKKDFVKALRLHWENEQGTIRPWNLRSEKARFSIYGATEAAEQKNLLKELAYLHDQKERRGILYADMADINQMPHQLNDNVDEAAITIGESQGGATRQLPHAMYLLATEGRYIELDRMKSEGVAGSKVPMVIVATPEELKLMEDQTPLEREYGLMQSFQINRDYLWTQWRVHTPDSPQAAPDIKRAKDQPISELERDVFPDLIRSLETLADPKQPAQHTVLLIPEEIEPLVQKLILSRWAGSRGPVGPWDHRNRNLRLFRFDQKIEGQRAQVAEEDNGALTQSTVFNNLQVMREAGEGKRAFLLGNLIDIAKGERLAAGSNHKSFTIADWASTERSALAGMISDSTAESDQEEEGEESEDESTQDSSTEDSINEGQVDGKRVEPHVLYLLENEGRKIQPKEFVAEGDKAPHEISMLFIGTHKEWEKISHSVHSFEDRFGLTKRFNLIELQPPSQEKRKELLKRVATSPRIQSLRYRYDAGNLGKMRAGANANASNEMMLKVLGYIVNRAETLSKEFRLEITSQYIRILSEFSRALVEDNHLRESKVIDRNFAERLLSRVFSIPMNLNTLPPDDPLRRLSADDAPLQLQNAGYNGSLELKAHVIRTILAQTRIDPVKSIPSSMILFGDTGSGKTYLFKTLIKMLGLKEFDMTNPRDPQNDEAGAIIVNVGRLVPEDVDDNGEVMSVKTALEHLNHFLSLPQGYRGWILFDDVHKADKKVISQIITWQQSLLEAPGGMFRARNMNNGEVRDIPVRNLVMMMTLNPTQDQDKINKFKDRNRDKPTDEEVIIATMSSEEFPIERSFLMRWGLVMALTNFPVDAKTPQLQHTLRSGARNDFNVKGQLTMVSPAAVRHIVDKFPDTNAREFLSSATSQLLSVADKVSDRGSLFVVVPSRTNPNMRLYPHSTGSGSEGSEIESTVRTSTAAIPIESRIDGKLHFLQMQVDAFRTDLFETLITALTEDTRYAGSPSQQRSLLAPFLHAIVSTITLKGEISLGALNLDPYDFNARTPIQQREFLRMLERMTADQGKFFPIRFADEFRDETLARSLIDANFHSSEERNRAQVMSEFSARIRQLLVPYLATMARVKNLDLLPTAENWLHSIKEEDPQEQIRQTGRALADLFIDFKEAMHERGLIETQDAAQFATINSYAEARLFLIAMDRAITKLPWGRLNHFLVDGLAKATEDMDLGQLPGVQHYLFTSKKSLVKPATHELPVQMASASQSYKEWTPERVDKVQQEFSSECERMLVQKD